MAKLLISTSELEEHLGDPRWIVFDTRHELMDPDAGPAAYAAGHVPGAYFLHTDDDLSGKKTGANGRHPLPRIEDFAAKINAAGVTPDTQVVVYDDLGGNFAVRLWWMLRWLGHDKVALLDGQWPQWHREGHPVTKEVPKPRQGSFVPKPMLGATVDTPFVERFREDPAMPLVDARAPERFKGLKEPIDPVAGHIPGAINRFWQMNLQADGKFKAPDVLRREFAELLDGAAPQNAMHMCGSGVTACHNIFAMELAGLPGGRLYAGSWSEWVADRSRPVAAMSVPK